jgi:hypothetical protein
MGMDIDYLVAKQSIEELETLLRSIEHGEREQISDDIVSMVDKLIKKYEN